MRASSPPPTAGNDDNPNGQKRSRPFRRVRNIVISEVVMLYFHSAFSSYMIFLNKKTLINLILRLNVLKKKQLEKKMRKIFKRFVVSSLNDCNVREKNSPVHAFNDDYRSAVSKIHNLLSPSSLKKNYLSDVFPKSGRFSLKLKVKKPSFLITHLLILIFLDLTDFDCIW